MALKLLKIPFSVFLSLLGFGGFGFFSVLLYPYFLITGFKESEVRYYFYLISRYVMSVVKFSANSFVVEMEPPPPGSAVVVANHSSILDILCISQFGLKDIVFLTRGWPLKVPVMGRYLRAGAGISLDAEDGEDFNALIAKVRSVFEKKLKLVIFPEGTRSADGSVHRFRSGAFALAQECGVTVIPAALKGLGRAIPKGKFLLTSSDIRLTLLAPVAPFTKEDMGALKMAKYVRQLITAKLEEK
jgi:1-acyl-sn-glycerol-3-phosphate acyltransferase